MCNFNIKSPFVNYLQRQLVSCNR